jgi:hypothetical protein
MTPLAVAWLATHTLALAVLVRLARRSAQDGPGLDLATVQAMALTSPEHAREILATDTTGLPRCACRGYGIPVGADFVVTPDQEPTAHSVCLCQPIREMVR